MAATRILLTRNPFFARVLASIAKVEYPVLKLPLAISWKNDLPLLQFNRDLLHALDQHPTWLAEWLEEELLHLILAHPVVRNEYTNEWAFHWAADLDAWQYRTPGTNDDIYESLCRRLHLPRPFTLQQAYEALLNLKLAGGQNQFLSAISTVPLSRANHYSWQQYFHADQGRAIIFWRKNLRRFISAERISTNSRFSMLYNLLQTGPTKPTIHWATLLRRFVQSGQRNLSQSSLRRPSKRYHNFPGTRRIRQTRLAVIIDTSGSIDQQLRTKLFQELQQLQGMVSAFDMIEADYQVRKTYTFTGEIPTISYGGGATNFDSALRYINQQPHFDGVIYLTDGAGPIPTVNCRFPLLWLLTDPESDLLFQSSLPGTTTVMQIVKP